MEHRVLIFPESLAASSIPQIIRQAGVSPVTCTTAQQLAAEIGNGADVVITEEAALSPQVSQLLQWALDSQPLWSELPIIVLLDHGCGSAAAMNALLLSGNVTLMERPLQDCALPEIVRSALRGRSRQYLVRDQLYAMGVSENRYRALFNSMDEGFCIIQVSFDDYGRAVDYLFLETNPAFQKHTGLANAEGQNVRQLMPKLEACWLEIYGQIALTGKPHRFEKRDRQLHRWFDVFAFRVGRSEDRQVAILFKDVTERKRKEHEVVKLNRDLTCRAGQLAAANQDLEAFNYSASHDLRTPLAVISGYIPLIHELCGHNLQPLCLGFLDEIAKASERMSHLIDALLNFSRVNRAQLNRQTVNLSAIATEVIGELMQVEPERRVSVHIAEGVQVDGDADLLRIVLKNLLGNAWKYTGKRDDAVIEFGAMTIGEEQACFVRDNGPGFDNADAAKLFTPFQRLSGTREYAGHGIGLATVERITRRHGGRVWAEGEPGKGATFYFTCQ